MADITTKMAEALRLAHDHIEMDKLLVSHPRDWALIKDALAYEAEAKPAPAPLTNADVVEAWRTTEARRDDYGWTSCEWFQEGVRFAQRHYRVGAAAPAALAALEAEAKPAPADRLGSVRCPKCWEMMSVPAAPALVSLTDDQIREVFLANGFTVKEGQTDLKPYVFAAARALLAKTLVAPAAPAPSADLCERICAAIVAEDTKSVDEAGYMLDSNDCCRIVREQFAAAPAAPAPHPDTQDAERLRYLLSDDGDWTLCEWDHDAGYWVSDQREPDVVRAAIDAAIAASKGGAA